MKTSELIGHEILIPVVIGKNRLRGNSEGAMILDDGVTHLVILRQVLAKEAKAKDVEPTEDWLRNSVSQVLRLYEKGNADWVANKGGTIGWIYEMNLPSGQVLKLGDARVLGMKLCDEIVVNEELK